MCMNAIILRSVSGAGKSHVADAIKALDPENVTICCADDFHMVDGEYKFDINKMGAAHATCLRKFEESVDEGQGTVIVANTNTSEREFKKYKEYAESKGYLVISLIVENRHGGKDSHNVPEATLEKQEDKLKNSIKLR